MGRKGVFPPPSTVSWLHDYLIAQGEANPYGFYKYLLSESKRLTGEVSRLKQQLTTVTTRAERARIMFDIRFNTREAKRYGAVSYPSIRKVFYMLHRLDIIEFVREEPASRGGSPKRFYRIVPGKENWFVPGIQQVIWPETEWGGKRYKSAKRYNREPPKRTWPPEV